MWRQPLEARCPPNFVAYMHWIEVVAAAVLHTGFVLEYAGAFGKVVDEEMAGAVSRVDS